MAARVLGKHIQQLGWGARTTTRHLHASLSAAAQAGETSKELKNVKVNITEDGIAIVKLDMQGAKVNTLSNKLSAEMGQLLDQLENDPKVRAAVIMSAKDSDFIAGADINMFTQCKSEADMQKISSDAHEMFARLASGKPKVAAINGTCLGGGCEFALACNYRIASESPKTVFGFPEVMLGILPGAGGTQRLPKLVGLTAALPLILTGQRISAQKAKKLKLVDQLCDPFALEQAALQAARGLADGKLKVNREPQGLIAKATKAILEGTSFGSNFVFKKAREGVIAKTAGNYPAPLKIIDVLETSLANGGFDTPAGYAAEAKAFGELGMTPESRALVTIFFGQTASKKNPFGAPKSSPKTVGVLGAGLMGAGIAQVSVQKGYNVVLKDSNLEALGRGLAQIEKNLTQNVKKKKMTTFERDTTMARINPLADDTAHWGKQLAKADIVIEAVFENVELKHKIIRQLEEILPEHCVFASNTSAIPIAKLAEASKRPQKFVGMHYFSPVDKMPLLEIITHKGTSPDTAAVAYEVGLRQGKTPIVVKDVPGFFVNRCLGPYSDEGLAVLLDGASITQVDKAMLKYGFPVGPMALVDEVGIQVAASVGKNLKGDLGVRVSSADPAFMEEGRKNGKGMYVYPPKVRAMVALGLMSQGKKTVNPEVEELLEKCRAGRPARLVSNEDIQLRMITRFVNEAALCLQHEIIANPTVGDIGSVFGIGFPPFRGGPFRLVDSFGAQAFVDVMRKYRDALGPQFEPAPILLDYAKANKKFHQ